MSSFIIVVNASEAKEAWDIKSKEARLSHFCFCMLLRVKSEIICT